MTMKNNISLDHVLFPRIKLDLIFDVDLINNFIDIRNALVYVVTDRCVIISQATPCITSQMIGNTLEATFVCQATATSALARLGWQCQIQELLPDFRLHPGDTQATPAVAISRPNAAGLTEANARMDYRVSVTNEKKIVIQTHPSFGQVHLLDFSAGGVLIGIPKPPQAKVGMRLWFTLFLPLQSASARQIAINGEAEVVRVAMNQSEQFVRIGLKFFDLDLEATRTLQKAINFYMLEEQRGRARSMPLNSPPTSSSAI